MTGHPLDIPRRAEVVLVVGVMLVAFILRAGWHRVSPPGWRDDELSNALVLAGHVRDGEVRLYYDDASGHEGLYHWLQAITMTLFGTGVAGIRGVSILLGTAGVALTYLLARRLFDAPTALLAAALLTVSFWSLMYSRIGQRHITVTVTTLGAFLVLWAAFRPHPVSKAEAFSPAPLHQWRGADRPQGGRGEVSDRQSDQMRIRGPERFTPTLILYALSGALMGTGFYTYFASRGVPLIVLAWGLYLFIWRRESFKAAWRGLAVSLGVAILLAIPLLVTLRQNPAAEARVAELARPVYEARAGDFSTLGDYAIVTLSMFTHNGDDEALYNIPHRPVFGPPGGLMFWAGLLISLWRTFGPDRDPRHAFLLLWLGAGLSPGVLSVPAASLSHTILALPVSMILAALPFQEGLRIVTSPLPDLRSVFPLSINGEGRERRVQRRVDTRPYLIALIALACLLTGWEGLRGVRDIFLRWPQDGFARVVHHADLVEAARWLEAEGGPPDLAAGSYLTERWDQQAMQLELPGGSWRVRFVDPRSAQLYPAGGGVIVLPEYLDGTWGVESLAPLDAPGTFRAYETLPYSGPSDPLVGFENGLTLLDLSIEMGNGELVVISAWRAEDRLILPEFPLYSKPPAPDEDDSPRLWGFTQLLDASGGFLIGADGLGVDPYTLTPGDIFRQRVSLPVSGFSPGVYTLLVGLYNPHSGERIPAGSLADSAFRLPLELP